MILLSEGLVDERPRLAAVEVPPFGQGEEPALECGVERRVGGAGEPHVAGELGVELHGPGGLHRCGLVGAR